MAIGETPFSLAYGSEAAIPAEVNIPSIKTEHPKEASQEDELRLNLDTTDELREIPSSGWHSIDKK